MAAWKTVSAKITRPGLSGVVRREKLFRLLSARMQRPVVWISACAGSGKTTLVASYLEAQKCPCIWYRCDAGDADPAAFFHSLGLAAQQTAPKRKPRLPQPTPESPGGLPAFARRYFEKLSAFLVGRPPAPGASARVPASKKAPGAFAMVLDNYQDLPADSPLHGMIAHGFDLLPRGLHAIVISRNDPPPAFARLQASGKIGLLTNEDLRLSLAEVRALVRGRLPGRDEKRLKAIHKTTEGWAAGITLLLEQARLKGADAKPLEPAGPECVFDYFAEEVFNTAEPEAQDFLLKTSFLPVLNASLAEQLTGIGNTGRILASLHKRNFFLERLSEKGQDFRYHSLFRSFLLDRIADTATPAELAGLRKKAGQLMERHGQVEEAARLYAAAGDVQSLAGMAVRQAREFLRQGRHKTVAEWIAAIPASVVDDNPWLLFWAGMCSFLLDTPRARDCLEKALALFASRDDASGVFLSWAGLFDTCLYEIGNWERLDRCVEAMEGLKAKYPSFPSRETELIVSSKLLISLILKNAGRQAQLEEWRAHVAALLAEDPSLDVQMDAAFYMSLHYLWQGAYNRNAVLLERAAADVLHHKTSSLAVIRIKMMQGVHAWITAQYDEAVKTLSSGLEFAKKSGLHIFDSLLWSFQAAAQMATGRMKQAEKSLQRQKESLLATSNTLDVFFYHVNRAWHALLQGKAALAASYLEAIAPQVERIGTPYYRALWHIGMAQASFGQDRGEEAGGHISTALRIGLEMNSQVVEWYALVVSAWFLLRQGRKKEGLEALARGFLLGKTHGYVHLEFYQPAVMQLLCATALEQGIEPDYARGLIRKLNLAAPAGIFGREDWPCPLTIRTLGGFEIFRNDALLSFTGKVQKKPLDLLKALIAAGGANVPVKDLTDELWPDASGDKASKSFETALGRLRRLLGGNRFITYGAGQLGLDLSSCRVDSLTLEQLLAEMRKFPADQANPLWDKASALYKGPFLPSESLPWAAHRREALKNGMLRSIIAAGRHHERAGAWEQAAAWWMRGLEVDDLAEYFYQRLMVCHAKLGNNSEAAKTYLLCRGRLHDQLGIGPSAETQTLYSTLIKKQ